MAVHDALEMEKNNNKAILELHEVASNKKDPGGGFYLPEQVVEIDQLTRPANQLQLMGVTSLGVKLFQKASSEKN